MAKEIKYDLRVLKLIDIETIIMFIPVETPIRYCYRSLKRTASMPSLRDITASPYFSDTYENTNRPIIL